MLNDDRKQRKFIESVELQVKINFKNYFRLA